MDLGSYNSHHRTNPPVNIPSPKGEGFRETAQAGYGSAKGRLQSHTILKLSSGSSGV